MVAVSRIGPGTGATCAAGEATEQPESFVRADLLCIAMRSVLSPLMLDSGAGTVYPLNRLADVTTRVIRPLTLCAGYLASNGQTRLSS